MLAPYQQHDTTQSTISMEPESTNYTTAGPSSITDPDMTLPHAPFVDYNETWLPSVLGLGRSEESCENEQMQGLGSWATETDMTLDYFTKPFELPDFQSDIYAEWDPYLCMTGPYHAPESVETELSWSLPSLLDSQLNSSVVNKASGVTKLPIPPIAKPHKPDIITKYTCQYCSVSCTQQKDLKRHMRSKHDDSSSVYLCPTVGCRRAMEGKGFKRKDKLDEHLRTH